jgi:SAM-dependent methyltransferase
LQKSDLSNLDRRTVEDFGREWARFDQRGATDAELQKMFEDYFAVFPWETLPADATGFDAGCGTGRWAIFVAQRAHRLHCLDASHAALDVARTRLGSFRNVEFHHCSIADMPLAERSMDFGYSLGVLHHMPDTAAGIAACVSKLKPGAPFLVYLYYAFDNKPVWFYGLWLISDLIRRFVSRLPFVFKARLTEIIAATVYWPFARLALLAEKANIDVAHFPLSAYRYRSFYSMRTDALDRFGTRLEHRFTRADIARMMKDAGLVDVRFSERVPYWCAVGRRAG